MKPICFATILLSIMLCSISKVDAQQANTDFYDAQLWVQLKPTATKSLKRSVDKVDIESFRQLIGKELSDELGIERVRKPFHFAIDPSISEVYQIFLSAGQNELAVAKRLEQLALVNYAERVPIMRPTLTPNDLGPVSGTNDQWGLHKIQAQQAWDITTGNTSVKVAIVDDAVLTTHPDLIPNLLPGYDVADNDNNAMPNETGMSHGTHVAGIVSAATNNGIGVASIGFNVKIIPVKSSNSSQFISDAYAGVVWAYQNDADVINMSWGGSGYSQTGQNIMNNAYNAGCVNVAAAGNDGVSTIFYPAGYANVISVASTTTNDAKSGFSNYGSWIDISAPGSAIRSTYFTGNYTPSYADLQGTSMASPMVAGLCGLVKSVNPLMTQTQIENCVLSTADNINSVNGSFIGQLGAGRINAYQAVLCAQTTINAPPIAVIESNNALRCPGGTVQFYGSSIGGLPTTYNWSFPGGIPSTSTLQNPLVTYPSLGNYNVSLTLSNSFGTDTETQNNYVEISTNGTDIFFDEDFENGTFAQNGWTVQNPDNSTTWEIFTVAGSVSGTKAAGINLYNYNASGQRDALISPVIDLSGHTNVQLDFQHAHRRYSADYRDSLIIYLSTNGGSTYPNRVFAQAENGSGSFATNSILAQNFVPTNGIDWCFGGDLGSGCFTVDLSQFDGQSNVRLRFEIYNNYGNNIYVDNIELSGNCFFAPEPPVADFSASVSTVCAGQSVQFSDESSNVPTSYQWSFPGGTPATSTAPSPSVTYNTPGIYSATLTVSNSYGTDQLQLNNLITVNASPSLSVNDNSVELCQGQSFTLVASGAQTYSWSPATGLSATSGSSVVLNTNASGSYTVTGSTAGCQASQIIDVVVNSIPAVPTLTMGNTVGFVMLNTPAASGSHPYAEVGTGWGFAALATQSVEADMVIARSNTGDSLMCGAANNAAQINGKIAVVYRGTCEFASKALRAQNAGAVAVIIVNNTGTTETIAMGAGADGASVTIPTIMVSANVGAAIWSAVHNGNARAVLGQFNGGSFSFCPGESVRVAAPYGYDQYEWTNGDNSAIGVFEDAGTHQLMVYNSFGCSASSVSFNVTEFTVNQPSITEQNGSLNANANGSNYAWTLNGQPIVGNTAQIPLQGGGSYVVTVTDANGCVSESVPYDVLTVGINNVEASKPVLWPVPTRDMLNISMPEAHSYSELQVFSTDGRLLISKNVSDRQADRLEVDVRHLAAGHYMVRLMGTDATAVLQLIKN